MESEPVLDPTVRQTEYTATYTGGPRGSAVPVIEEEDGGKKPAVSSADNREVEITPAVKSEVDRLRREYTAKRTQEHYDNLRAKGNITALKLLGLAILAYAYMGLAVMLASDVELNL